MWSALHGVCALQSSPSEFHRRTFSALLVPFRASNHRNSTTIAELFQTTNKKHCTKWDLDGWIFRSNIVFSAFVRCFSLPLTRTIVQLAQCSPDPITIGYQFDTTQCNLKHLLKRFVVLLCALFLSSAGMCALAVYAFATHNHHDGKQFWVSEAGVRQSMADRQLISAI